MTSELASEPAGTTALDALARRSELLFTQDARGRLLGLRETGEALAPRFYLARGPLGCIWRIRADLPREIVVALARLAGKEGPLAAGTGAIDDCPPPERMEAFRNVLRQHGPILHEYRGPAFRFPAVIPDAGELAKEPATNETSGRPEALRLDARRQADRALLMKTSDDVANPDELALSWLDHPSELSPQTDCFAIVRGRQIVSACWTARALPGVGVEAGVRTIASQRGRGFAPIAVAAWARSMREGGLEPHYSTEWTHKASRAVARRLGLILFAEDLHFG